MKPLAILVTAALLCCLSMRASGQGVLRTPASDTTKYMMKQGSYLGFRQVNLSMGEIGFEVVISSNLKGKSAPRLEFRIDRPNGKRSKKLGSIRIPDTADTTFNVKLTGQLRHAIGIHDLFLVAKGAGEFEISGFSFIHNYFAEK
jgi:hypothetical protein